MTAQVINLFEPCYLCGKPPVDGERCADCLAYRSVLKSIARNIRHHLKICKNKERAYSVTHTAVGMMMLSIKWQEATNETMHLL